MRKGFQKLAAEMLVEATEPNKDLYAVPHKGPTIITVDFSGDKTTKFIVPPEKSVEIIKAIDDVGDSQEEKFQAIDPSLVAKSIRIKHWLEASFQGSPTQLSQSQAIFDNEFLKDPSCVELFGSLPNPSSKKEYTSAHPLILKLAEFIPSTLGKIQDTTGPGEFAIGYLMGVPPARAAGYDFIGESGVEYTVKHQMSTSNLDTFTYKFNSKWKSDLLSNYENSAVDSISDDKARKRIKNSLQRAKKLLSLDEQTPITYSYVVAAALGLTRPIGKKGFVSENGRTRWALVCSLGKNSFSFRAFSISERLMRLHRQELASSRSGNPVVKSGQISMNGSEVNIKLNESLKIFTLISELSRRDQQDVEAIARRIAQEVLEDELGDDFDKAVRREMLASLKDKEVESGVADVSRDFMRKFYRSLGTASSSPLDKVKV